MTEHRGSYTVTVTPFDEETLQHFLFIERPEGMEMDDGSIYRAPGNHTLTRSPAATSRPEVAMEPGISR